MKRLKFTSTITGKHEGEEKEYMRKEFELTHEDIFEGLKALCREHEFAEVNINITTEDGKKIIINA